MAEYRLKPTAAPDPRLPIICLPDDRPFATGNGPNDYLCGRCGNGLLLKVDIVLPKDITVVCGKCRTANLLVSQD